MSFGYSIGDVLATAALCYKLYRAISDAPEELIAVRGHLVGLTDLLREVQNAVDGPSPSIQIDKSKRESLYHFVETCGGVLLQLEEILRKYATVESGRKRDRISRTGLKFSINEVKALAGIKQNLMVNLSLLNNFWQTIQSSQLSSLDARITAQYELMTEVMQQILGTVLQGQNNPQILLPEKITETGELDISDLAEELVARGVSHSSVESNADNIREYIERNRDVVSTIASQRDCFSEMDIQDPSVRSDSPTLAGGEAERKSPKEEVYYPTVDEEVASVALGYAPWDGSAYLDMLDAVKASAPPPDNTAHGDVESPPSAVNQIICPLCLKFFHIRNAVDHISQAHDNASKQRFLTLAFIDNPTEPERNQSTAMPSPGDGKCGSDKLTDAAEDANEPPVCCPTCHANVGLNGLGEHLAGHDNEGHGSSVGESWQKVLAVPSVREPPLPPILEATPVHIDDPEEPSRTATALGMDPDVKYLKEPNELELHRNVDDPSKVLDETLLNSSNHHKVVNMPLTSATINPGPPGQIISSQNNRSYSEKPRQAPDEPNGGVISYLTSSASGMWKWLTAPQPSSSRPKMSSSYRANTSKNIYLNIARARRGRIN